MGSRGLNITAVAADVCPDIRESGPRCGVEVEVASFRRLAVGPEVSSSEGASGAADFDVVQSPTVPSADAESIRLVGPWMSIESMLPLWP